MVSGGGTGGHIYPAIAIANAWKERHPGADILFVGAEGKMEMQKVPEAGYKIIGLTIAGLQRKLTLSNLSFPIKLWGSIQNAKKLLEEFKPKAVVGVGGYASGPLLYAAQGKGIPTLLQEQNSYAGLTNKLLAKKAKKICVAYPGMEKFFPASKIVFTGNPVRKDILDLVGKRDHAMSHFGLDKSRKTILLLGGSLGAKTINEATLAHMQAFESDGYQLLWQSGKYYHAEMQKKLKESGLSHIHLLEFIKEMDLAYAAADLIVSRAGALSVSELSLVGKPVIFIPSPNVVADHQTKNAAAYVAADAAILLKDEKAVADLKNTIDELMASEITISQLSKNIKKLSKPNAAEAIVENIEEILS